MTSHKNGQEYAKTKKERMLTVTFILLLLCLLSVIDPIFPIGNIFREYIYIPFLLATLSMAVWQKEPAFFLPYALGSAIYDLLHYDVFWTIQIPLFTIIVCIKYWKSRRSSER